MLILSNYELNCEDQKVGVRGIEPPTSRSQTERSTDELHPEVPRVGVEPTRLVSHSILSAACIPFHHRG